MAKQFAVHHVCWKDASDAPAASFWPLGDEKRLRAAAARALETKLNALADDGWIIDAVHPDGGLRGREGAGFTVVAFK
ncbi:MAG: hypothetical protein AAGC56_05205 [Pseudomonadota bacterium]